MKTINKVKLSIMLILSVLCPLFACLFSMSIPAVNEFSSYQTCVRDISESDLKWAVGEIKIDSYSYGDYRSVMGKLENELNMVSRPEYVCFVGRKTNELNIISNDKIIELNSMLINISQVCQPNDSFGYFYGLPVKPLFTFDYCDWNYVLNRGFEPCYISERTAFKLMSADPSLKDFSDLIGCSYEIEINDCLYPLSIANIFSYDYGAGPMLADYYDELIVVANKAFFTNDLFLNISFTNDLIACRDFCYSMSNYDVESISIKVKSKNNWRDIKNIERVSSICLNKVKTNYVLIAIYSFLLLAAYSIALISFKKFGVSGAHLLAAIGFPCSLLFLITLFNLFVDEYIILYIFNPLLSLLVICHIVLAILVWWKRKKSV